MTDPDEHIDPLDPRFVDAVLARARRRATTENPAAPTPPATDPGTAPSTSGHAPGQAPPNEPPPAAESPSAATPTANAPPATAAPAPSAPTSEPHSTSVYDIEPEDEHTVATARVDAPHDLDTDADLDEDDDGSASRRTRTVVEWIAVAVGAVVVAFLIRAFLLQAFYIPSESMEPTLRQNDRILVNKLSYKLHDVNRGDLVVFEKPENEPTGNINDLIKRAIGLEGETIELHADGTITIDGRLLSEPYLRDGQPPGQMTMARENFVEGACTNPVTEATRCTIGDGFVWVMGDNRDHSHDSRAFGPIDEDLIIGRAFVKVWPLSNIGFL